MIRIADYVGSRRFDIDDWFVEETCEPWRNIPAIMAELHSIIADEYFLDACDMCEDFAKFHDVDLWSIIREKLRYNATRPHRHGGKKA